MKLRGEFVMCQIADDTIVLPTGDTLLKFNGMIMLNSVSKLIWHCLEEDTTVEEILQEVLEEFEVTAQEAKEDIQDFLEKLRELHLLDE